MAPDLPFLGPGCPLPLDEPFTVDQAKVAGVSRHFFRQLLARGMVRQVVRGAYVAAQVVDTIELRSAAVRLVVPAGAIIVDRTAAWLHGVDVLPRTALREMPPLEVFSADGSRLRRPGVASGIRTLTKDDVTMVGGVQVTTPLRTALDLGRLLWRYDSIAALDAFVRFGVPKERILANVERFRGQRGVVQLRELALLADHRPESAPESALFLHWRESALPDPVPQYWVCNDNGIQTYRIDLAQPVCKYGAEYYGELFHGPDDKAANAARIAWLESRGWTIDIFTKVDLYKPGCDPKARLAAGVELARRKRGQWVPQTTFTR